MWAAADAGFAGLEPPATTVHVPAQAPPETGADLWASIDAGTLIPNG